MKILDQEASLMAQAVRNLPVMQETQETCVQPLGQEDPLKEEMAAHSSILAWKIPCTEVFGGLDTTEHACMHFQITHFGYHSLDIRL